MKRLMNRYMTLIAMAVIYLTTFNCTLFAQSDWPRFRGVDGSGVSADEVPTEWGPDKNIRWKTKLPGAGCSSPIIVGGKVFVTCYSGYGESRSKIGKKEDLKRHIVCIEQDSGTELWKKTVPTAPKEDDFSGAGVPAHGYASHTPVSDGQSLFVFFGKSGVIAYDLDGQELWKKDVGSGSDSRRWGSAASPIVYEDLLIVPALAESRAVIALDKKTGEQKWSFKSGSLDKTWATPIIVPAEEGRSDIVIGVPNELWAINPESGKLRWAASGVGGDGFFTSAIADGEMIYASVGGRSGGGSIAVKSGGRKDVTKSHVSWNGKTMASFATPVFHDGLLFMIGRSNRLAVVDAADGKELSEVRFESTKESKPAGGSAGRSYSSPIVAGGKLYYTTGNGETFVMTADEDCQQIAANKLTDDAETFSGTPAISNGQIFIRSNRHLYCIGQ